jgi:hypothetical protein
MRTYDPLVLLVFLIAGAASTRAADLNGGWVIDASTCDQVFAKENNRLVFKPDADLSAGGLIVDGRKVTGTLQKCTIKSLHDVGSNLQLMASCSDGVAVSDVTFDLKMSGDNKMVLSSQKPVPVEMPYVRCPVQH